MSSGQSYFDIISNPPEKLGRTTEQFVRFVSPHVEPSPHGIKKLNWSSLKDAIDDRPGADLTILEFDAPFDASVKFEDLPSTLADHILRSRSIPLKREDIIPNLKKAFADLKCAKEAGWADFQGPLSDEPTEPQPPKAESTRSRTKTVEPPKSWWEYRALIPTGDPAQTEDLIGMVCVTQISSPELPKEEDWYPQPKAGSKQEIKLVVTVMKLSVDSDFEGQIKLMWI